MIAAKAPEPRAPAPTPDATRPVGIAGLGVHLPDDVVTNDDWAAVLDTDDEWIRTRTGIRERRRIADDETTSDLAARAAIAALDDADRDADELGAIIVATTTPDHIMPQTAPIVAARLGVETGAFDVGAACSGFVYALSVGSAMVATEPSRPVLVIGAEALTRFVDERDRSTAVLFGDGAGACVLAPDGGSLGPFDTGSDGALSDVLVIPDGGARNPPDETTVEGRGHYISMDGSETYRQAVSRMADSSRTVIDRAGLDAEDVDLLVGHQANARILTAVAERIGIPQGRAFIDVDRFGNTSAASIPIALADAREQGELGPGSTVLLTAFGAGLTWGSCLLTTPEPAAV